MNGRRMLQIGATALVIFLLARSFFASPPAEGAVPHPRNVERAGTRILVRLLERLEVPVRVSAAPFTELHDEGSVLVLPVPHPRALPTIGGAIRRAAGGGASQPSVNAEAEDKAPREAAGLEEFVARGNCIILPVAGAWAERGDAARLLHEVFGIESTVYTNAVLADSKPVDLSSRVIGATQLRDVPRGASPVSAYSDVLFASAVPYKKGRIVLVASIERMTNGSMRDAETNAVESVRMLESERRGGKILFDSYWLGDRDPASALSAALSSSVMPTAMHLLAAALVFAAAHALRFGAARVPRLAPEHGQLEAARGIASLYRRARKPALAAAAVARGFEARLRAATGMPHAGTIGDVAEAAAPRTGASRDELLQLLTAPASSSDAELLQRAARTAAIESRLRRDSHAL